MEGSFFGGAGGARRRALSPRIGARSSPRSRSGPQSRDGTV